MIYYHLCYHFSGAPSKDTPEWWRMHQEELGFDRSGIDEKNVNSANQYLKSYKDSRYQKVIEAGEGGTAIIKQSARILKMETREDISREEICRLKREDFRIHEIVKKSEKRIGFA